MFFLGIAVIIPVVLFLLKIGFTGISEPTTISKKEIIAYLKQENIVINDDFQVLESKNEEDLYFNRTQFKIKLSNKQFEKLQQKNFQKDTLKNFTKEENGNNDTLRIFLIKNEILRFYKSQFYDN